MPEDHTNATGDSPEQPTPAFSEAVKAFSYNDVLQLANAAADDVLDEIEAGDEGTRDAVNLVVCTLLSRMQKPGLSIRDVIIENHAKETPEPGEPEETDDEMVARVIDWCQR